MKIYDLTSNDNTRIETDVDHSNTVHVISRMRANAKENVSGKFSNFYITNFVHGNCVYIGIAKFFLMNTGKKRTTANDDII